MMTSSKSLPKDLQAMSNILRDFGITDYESSVENHMLEFTNSMFSINLNKNRFGYQ